MQYVIAFREVRNRMNNEKRKNENIQNEYIYDKINRIVQPEKYQFSIYGGAKFLKAYEKSRSVAITTIETKMQQLLPKHFHDLWAAVRKDTNDERKFIINYYKEAEVEIINKQKNIGKLDKGTASDLSSCWDEVMKCCIKDELDGQIIKKTMKYLKKYEVSKKIYDDYDSVSKRDASRNYQNPITYILLSNLLCDYLGLLTDKHEELIVFNTILKLNDLIVSVMHKLFTPTEALLTYLCLFSEKNFYMSLFQEA